MNPQTQTPDLFTQSPINNLQLGKQNRIVYDHLMSGKTINCIEAQAMGITALNSRISDLRNIHEIKIVDKFVNIGTGKSMVKQYWIEPAN